jgi:hypothetical protein
MKAEYLEPLETRHMVHIHSVLLLAYAFWVTRMTPSPSLWTYLCCCHGCPLGNTLQKAVSLVGPINLWMAAIAIGQEAAGH